MNDWENVLSYWDSPDWAETREKLDVLESSGAVITPRRSVLFRALDDLPPDRVRCVIVGQDPYPDPRLGTGYAFSVPPSSGIPPSLRVILQEYADDLSLPVPTSGDLSSWVSSGVLLWNCFPSCTAGKSLSHSWDSYKRLTDELVEHLATRGVVFILVGAHARRLHEAVCYYDLVYPGKNRCIVVGHPSPRGSPRRAGRSNWPQAFRGSRIFSKTNDYLVQLGKEPINWKLG